MKNNAQFSKDRPSKFFIDKSCCPNFIENPMYSQRFFYFSHRSHCRSNFMLILIVSVGCAKLCSTIVVILYRIQYSSRLPFDDSPGEAVCPPQFLKVKAKITHEGLNYCLCTTRPSLRRNVSFAIPSNQKWRNCRLLIYYTCWENFTTQNENCVNGYTSSCLHSAQVGSVEFLEQSTPVSTLPPLRSSLPSTGYLELLTLQSGQYQCTWCRAAPISIVWIYRPPFF